MLYFGEKDNEDFDFIFKTVISKPKLNKDGNLSIDYTIPSLLNLEQKGLESLKLRR